LNNFQELQELIEINSYTKNKIGVDKNCELYIKHLQALGYSYKTYKRDDIGNHIIFNSDKKDGKKLLLLGHIDTVFSEGTFCDFSENKEWIYGPGVCDMKGGNIVAIEALKNIYKKYGKIENIDLMLVSDEETGSDDSKHVTSKVAKDYDYCLVYEAAGENLEVVVARKGVGTFYIDIEGKAAHAGNNYTKGMDANLEASYKLQDLVKLTDLEKGTTVNVGKIKGGIGANTISPHAKLTFELRYTQKNERNKVLKQIDAIVNKSYVKGTISLLTGGIQRDVMEESENQAKFIHAIEAYTSEKLLTEKRGGVSDANIVASVGTAVLDGFGPFGDGDHTKHERALKSTFKQRINLSTKIFEGIIEGEI